MSTFAAFIDMKKALDWDLLLFNILSQFENQQL